MIERTQLFDIEDEEETASQADRDYYLRHGVDNFSEFEGLHSRVYFRRGGRIIISAFVQSDDDHLRSMLEMSICLRQREILR
jgi:hypothetical protein